MTKYVLNDGNLFNNINVGTHRLEEQVDLVDYFNLAINCGYTAFDTAQGYGNEKIIGDAIKKLKISREKVFLTSKLDDIYQNHHQAKQAIEQTLHNLGTDYIDCFLIHSPNSVRLKIWAEKNGYKENDYWKELNIEAWAVLEEYKKHGHIKSIGVSNFQINHLENLCQNCNVLPAINQIKLCIGSLPIQKETVDYCKEKGIALCGYRVLGKGNLLTDERVVCLSNKYKKTPVQIIFNYFWHNNYSMVVKMSNRLHLNEPIGYKDFIMENDDYEWLENYYSNAEYALIKNPDTGKGIFSK